MFDVWKNVLAEIERSIPAIYYKTFFDKTELVSAENGVVTIGTHSPFSKTQLERKYHDIIKKALINNNIKCDTINYEVVSSKPKTNNRNIVQVFKEKTARPKDGYSIETDFSKTNLNPDYTMDNFVVGSNNDLAVSVAENVINNPGKKYNPFFLYGGPGLGKTHLVQAIGNELLKKNPKIKILYAPMSRFYSDFINAIKNKRGDEFSQKFYKLDVLIIDDFQMIIGKEKSQEEFFNIFNELHQKNKQIIVTSDRLPSQIKEVDTRLASRLTWAGAIDLQMPKFEDKCAILKSKAEFEGVEIEDEAIEYIAENVKTNIRDLEGEFKRLLAMSDFRGKTPLELIHEGYISDINKSTRVRAVSPKQVVEKVAKYYQLPVKEMCGKSRVSHIKNARQVAMYILSKELQMSTTKIAYEVGVKDHTTVMHGVKKIEGDLKFNYSLRDQIEEIREKIYG
ncbi:chromosomal replication initiator protein DnaA [Candidatus Saccharibacteria bacterium]|nr:chromosomal replication initiator protein DnaA [Candidatus Saccharibacteria bacterium]